MDERTWSASSSLALDLAGLEHVLGQGLEDGFLLHGESQSLHLADQPALLLPDRGQPVTQGIGIPAEIGPVGHFVDIRNSLSALYAVIIAVIRRSVS